MKKSYRNLLALAVFSAVVASAGPSGAAFDSKDDDRRSEREVEEKLDLTVTKFSKNGTSGHLFEFNSMSVPNVRCVVFSFGGAGGMQCFPRNDSPAGGKPRE